MTVLFSLIFVGTWYKIVVMRKNSKTGAYQKSLLLIFFGSSLYLEAVLSTNYLTNVQNLYFSHILSLCDSALLLVYIFINTYIWPSGAFFWCLIPKSVITLALFFVHGDQGQNLIISLQYSSMVSLAHLLMSEEAMVYSHGKNENVSVLDMFVRINLDLQYNWAVVGKPIFQRLYSRNEKEE